MSAYVSIRCQHTSAYVSICQHTSAHALSSGPHLYVPAASQRYCFLRESKGAGARVVEAERQLSIAIVAEGEDAPVLHLALSGVRGQ